MRPWLTTTAEALPELRGAGAVLDLRGAAYDCAYRFPDLATDALAHW